MPQPGLNKGELNFQTSEGGANLCLPMHVGDAQKAESNRKHTWLQLGSRLPAMQKALHSFNCSQFQYGSPAARLELHSGADRVSRPELIVCVCVVLLL